ncbi:MAG TPA: hypothetical protein VNU49_01915 [Opitutaceae bacterium]|nr:hypothetical protein [Opitutaceae bacterium]
MTVRGRLIDEKTAARAAVAENEDADATLLFLGSSLLAGLAALEVGGTTFTFDDFIELLAHIERKEKDKNQGWVKRVK